MKNLYAVLFILFALGSIVKSRDTINIYKSDKVVTRKSVMDIGTVGFNTTDTTDTILFNPDLTYGSLTDIEGYIYKTIEIGTQMWMAENLKTSRYNDSTAIPLITVDSLWNNDNIGAYCWYNNDSASYEKIYGKLYNWYTVSTGKLCPSGWHVPTYAELDILATFLGDRLIAGGKLKETGTTHWTSPNTGASNSTGFTALPGGARYNNGFYGFGIEGDWRSSTDAGWIMDYMAWIRNGSAEIAIYSDFEKYLGQSVRCIQDNDVTNVTTTVNNLDFTIFPNPANDKLYIKGINSSNGLFVLYDIQGQRIMYKNFTSNPIDLTHVKKGVYIVQLIASGRAYSIKLVKE